MLGVDSLPSVLTGKRAGLGRGHLDLSAAKKEVFCLFAVFVCLFVCFLLLFLMLINKPSHVVE